MKGQRGREERGAQRNPKGFPSSTLEPRAAGAAGTISLSQKGKRKKVKGRLFERTKVIKIKSVSSAEREPSEGYEAFPSCSPLLFLCLLPRRGRGLAPSPRPAPFSQKTIATALGEGRSSCTPGTAPPLGNAFFPVYFPRDRVPDSRSLALMLAYADIKAKKLSGA